MLPPLTSEQIELSLRALKTVALADGVFDVRERALLEAAVGALGSDVDVDALAPVEPEVVGGALPDDATRERLLQALVITALMDQVATPPEVAEVDRWARALGVADPRVKSLHQLVDGHLRLVQLDIIRRSPLNADFFSRLWRREGVRGVWEVLATQGLGLQANAERAWRYRQLGLLPEGTLGRELWKHMTSRRFAFPGEVGGIPEVAVHHDFTHVLTGYGTDAKGELEIACFYAGYWSEDPFAFVFMAMASWHLGIRIGGSEYEVATGQFDPAVVARALARGAACKVDFTKDWDPWPVIERPVAELRVEYGL